MLRRGTNVLRQGSGPNSRDRERVLSVSAPPRIHEFWNESERGFSGQKYCITWGRVNAQEGANSSLLDYEIVTIGTDFRPVSTRWDTRPTAR
jgi:hypothetical protein